MKKLITAMIGTGLFLSCNAFAFTPECSNCGYGSGLCAPKYPGGFYIGVTGAYVQPSASGTSLNGNVVNFIDADGDFFRSEILRFDPKHKWAWGVDVGYDLPCSSYNIELSYFYFHNKSHNDHDLSTDPSTIGSFFFTNILFPVADVASLADPVVIADLAVGSELRYQFDQFDLKFGRQYNDACGHFQLHPSIGLRYAKIDHKYSSLALVTLGDIFAPAGFLDTVLDSHLHSKFDGVGPLASLDARYGFGNCGSFGIVGHFDAALIVGHIDSNASLIIDTTPVTADGTPVPGFTTETTEERYNAPSTDRVVTNLSGKIGVDYSFCFCNKSSLTIEVGYQASKYYDAIDLLRGDIFVPTTIIPTVFNTSAQRITNTDTNSFDFRGPYATVTYHL